tara:strand:+ start:433 stop:816 length:384 start_codon:yes stop_codon:yes gene_type:complete
MPESTRTFANIELKQGENYELVITMDSTWVTTNKTWSANIVKDTARTAFTHSGGSVNNLAMDVAGDNSAKTITLRLTAAQTQGFPDDFEGYWDILELDSGSGEYTRQAEGEVIVWNQSSLTSDTFGT